MKNKYERYPFQCKTTLLIACFGLLYSASTFAADPVIPSGSQLLPQNPQAPFVNLKNGTGLQVEKNNPAANNDKSTILIREINISGNTLFDTQTLHTLLDDYKGKKLNLEQLNELALRITHYYQERGYPVSRAYIPVQKIEDGVINFSVLEARYGAINVNNSSRLSTSRTENFLSPLKANALIETSTLNRSLLLLNDLPGVITHSSLTPGSAVGTSDLQVNIEPGQFVTGMVGIDNYGSRYNGTTRYNALLQLNNLSGQGDQFTVDGLTTGQDLMYGHLAYKTPVYLGVNVGMNLSRMTYNLKESLTPLQASGDQTIADLWASETWLRSVDSTGIITLRYTYNKLDDDVASNAIYKDRHIHLGSLENTLRWRDRYGSNSFYLVLSHGNLVFDDANAAQADAESAKTAGSFNKLNLTLSRYQPITDDTAVVFTAMGQLASKNLDASQQFTLGGPYNVRSYELGAVSGDQGYSLSTELRHTFNTASAGSWTPLIYVDTARLQLNKHSFAQGPNIADLHSTGLGLDVEWQGWLASGRFSHRLGAKPTAGLVSHVDDNKVWFSITKRF